MTLLNVHLVIAVVVRELLVTQAQCQEQVVGELPSVFNKLGGLFNRWPGCGVDKKSLDKESLCA